LLQSIANLIEAIAFWVGRPLVGWITPAFLAAIHTRIVVAISEGRRRIALPVGLNAILSLPIGRGGYRDPPYMARIADTRALQGFDLIETPM
jgi:hypothetical protein